jgi:hypothetical protein
VIKEHFPLNLYHIRSLEKISLSIFFRNFLLDPGKDTLLLSPSLFLLTGSNPDMLSGSSGYFPPPLLHIASGSSNPTASFLRNGNKPLVEQNVKKYVQ